MNKIGLKNPFKLIENSIPGEAQGLVKILLAISIVGLLISLLIFATTVFQATTRSLQVCLSNDCVENFLKIFSQVPVVLNATIQLLVAVSTIGGIFVALLNYLSSSKNEAMTNHLSHISLFKGYVDAELSKCRRVSVSSIDVMHLYNSIFSTSRSGRTDISEDYKRFVLALNSIIIESSKISMTSAPGGFRYTKHQQSILGVFAHVGVKLERLPRNDFFEMEGELLSFFERINHSFCFNGDIPKFEDRKYF